METIYFKDHRKSGDAGYDIYRLLTDIKGKKDIRIVFDKDIYEISPDYCFEKALHVSNHGWNGYKRIIALLEDMEDIELDFSGSTLLAHDVITPFSGAVLSPSVPAVPAPLGAQEESKIEKSNRNMSGIKIRFFIQHSSLS